MGVVGQRHVLTTLLMARGPTPTVQEAVSVSGPVSVKNLATPQDLNVEPSNPWRVSIALPLLRYDNRNMAYNVQTHYMRFLKTMMWTI